MQQGKESIALVGNRYKLTSFAFLLQSSIPGFAPLAMECEVHSGDVSSTSGLYVLASSYGFRSAIGEVITVASGKFALMSRMESLCVPP